MNADQLHPTNQKKFEDWTWDDLRTHTAWVVASALLKGEPLYSVMHGVCHITCEWHNKHLMSQKKARKK